jgi:hypothetical protein
MVFVRENGEIWGEILTHQHVRFLPEDIQIADPGRFFEIPSELQQHQLHAVAQPEDVILALKEPSGRAVCSFLKSQLSERCSLRAALDELHLKLQELIAPDLRQPAGQDIPD